MRSTTTRSTRTRSTSTSHSTVTDATSSSSPASKSPNTQKPFSPDRSSASAEIKRRFPPTVSNSLPTKSPSPVDTSTAASKTPIIRTTTTTHTPKSHLPAVTSTAVSKTPHTPTTHSPRTTPTTRRSTKAASTKRPRRESSISAPVKTPSIMSSDISEEIKNTVREEIQKIANKIIETEIEKEIEVKIGSRKISASRRYRVHRKVTSEVKKQAQELIDKIVEWQLKSSSSGNVLREERVSEDIEKELLHEIQTMVHRTMEKAIADEILSEVKIEKLSRTPTIEPEFSDKAPGTFGVRHAQTFMILLFLAISYMQRVDFNVAEVAMTNAGKANPNFMQFYWSERIISVLLSSFYWGYFFLQLPGGILAEKYGPKLVMTSSMMACSLLGLFIPVASIIGGWVGVYVLKFVQGICQGTFIPAVYVFTSRWIPPKEKSRLFTPAFGGMQLGVVVGMPITGILCASYLGWPSAFFFSSCVGLLWVVVWIFIAANSPSVHRSISREEKLYIEGSFGFGEITVTGAKKIIPWKDILTSIPFWALVIAHFGQNWSFSTLITEMPAYINNVLELDITENAFFSAMTYFIGWIFIVIFGFVANYFQEKEFLGLSLQRKAWNSVAALGGSICFMILGITQTNSQLAAITLLTVTVSTNSAAYNGVFSNHADLSPNYIGVLMGLSNMIANIASVGAPIYVGYIVEEKSNHDQWSIVFVTAAGILFFSNVIFIIFGTAEIQSWNNPRDLHLQLEKVDAAAMSRKWSRREHVYTVSNQEDEAEPPKSEDIKHRNSI